MLRTISVFCLYNIAMKYTLGGFVVIALIILFTSNIDKKLVKTEVVPIAVNDFVLATTSFTPIINAVPSDNEQTEFGLSTNWCL